MKTIHSKYKSSAHMLLSLSLILLAPLKLLSVFPEPHMGAPCPALYFLSPLHSSFYFLLPFCIRVQPPSEFHPPRTSWRQTLIFIYSFYYFYCIFSLLLIPLYPPHSQNHDTIVRVHESFFLFAGSLHSLTPHSCHPALCL